MSNLLLEEYSFLKQIPGDQKKERFFYHGMSMAPTFQPGQILQVNTNVGRICKGDVIVFRNRAAEDYIVHRVVAIKSNQFITRGDHNLCKDRQPIDSDQIVGKVESVRSEKKPYKVHSGPRGLFRSRVLMMHLFIKRTCRRLLRKPYRLIKRCGLIAKIWKPKFEQISLDTPDGSMVKYIICGRTVAVYWKELDKWRVRHPYDLVIPSHYSW